MRPAVQVGQAVGVLPGRGVDGVEVAGDDQPARPTIFVRGQPAGVGVDPGVAGQHGTGAGRVHHETGGVRADEVG